MQFAKDSFYVALRDRLGVLNPARTISVGSSTQPAIVLSGAQPVTADQAPGDCFQLSFAGVREAQGFERATPPLWTMDCTVTYYTRGSAGDGSDRERALSTLDAELLAICTPPGTPKLDYTQTPAQPLGTTVFWQRPQLEEITNQDGIMQRKTVVTLFFVSEVSA